MPRLTTQQIVEKYEQELEERTNCKIQGLRVYKRYVTPEEREILDKALHHARTFGIPV